MGIRRIVCPPPLPVDGYGTIYLGSNPAPGVYLNSDDLVALLEAKAEFFHAGPTEGVETPRAPHLMADFFRSDGIRYVLSLIQQET